MNLNKALSHPLYVCHKIGDKYTMDGKPELWGIAYYPLFHDDRTGKEYDEPRALIERPIQNGTDFREMPLRYLTKCLTQHYY